MRLFRIAVLLSDWHMTFPANARVIYIDLTDYEIDKECEEVNAAHDCALPVLAKARRWPLPVHQLTLQ
jgi:hypothetical protein